MERTYKEAVRGALELPQWSFQKLQLYLRPAGRQLTLFGNQTPKFQRQLKSRVGGCFVAATAAFTSRGLKTLGSWPGSFFIPKHEEASVAA
jgi:hypothetical protein